MTEIDLPPRRRLPSGKTLRMFHEQGILSDEDIQMLLGLDTDPVAELRRRVAALESRLDRVEAGLADGK